MNPEPANNFMEIKIASKSENVSFARVVISAFLAKLDPTLDELNDVKTAVSEAFTNAVIHGYDDADTGNEFVWIKAEISDRTLRLQMRDEGMGIDDINQVREPMYTSKPGLERSGMGFTIIENFMDELTIDSSVGSGTTLTMVKHFAPITQPATLGT